MNKLQDAKEVVRQFWAAMARNDFYAVGDWLTDDFVCYWPQSAEKIIGRKNFGDLNTSYPAHGTWKFNVNTIVCEGDCVVTDVSITDGTVTAQAITFHTVRDGRIAKQVEYWPDSYEAPAWRQAWVARLKQEDRDVMFG